MNKIPAFKNQHPESTGNGTTLLCKIGHTSNWTCLPVAEAHMQACFRNLTGSTSSKYARSQPREQLEVLKHQIQASNLFMTKWQRDTVLAPKFDNACGTHLSETWIHKAVFITESPKKRISLKAEEAKSKPTEGSQPRIWVRLSIGFESESGRSVRRQYEKRFGRRRRDQSLKGSPRPTRKQSRLVSLVCRKSPSCSKFGVLVY
jgi:hypothetical protein